MAEHNKEMLNLNRETLTIPKEYEQSAEYLVDYKPLSEMEKKAVALVEALQFKGFSAYFVGGFVRDMMLGKAGKDIDIATSAQPESLIALAKDYSYGFDEANKKFGMVRIVIDGNVFELTTFRTDGEYSDHRRPDSVEFTDDLYQDAMRRDFTFNAVYFDPLERKIIDFFGGLDDLHNDTLRFVGEQEKIVTKQYEVAKQRIEEDPLRIVRAIRFSARFGMKIDPEAERAMLENKDLLSEPIETEGGVSWERKGQELSSILMDKNRVRGFDLINEYDLWKYLLPEIDNLKNVAQGEKYHQEGDVYIHTRLGMEKINEVIKESSLPIVIDDRFISQLVWAWLLHDIAKPEAKKEDKGRITFYGHERLGAEKANKILRRYGFSQKDIVKPATWMIVKHMQVRNLWRTKKKSKLLEYYSHPNFFQLLSLLKIDSLSSLPSDLSDYNKVLQKYEMSVADGIFEKAKAAKEVINSRDILEVGFVQGPQIGIIKGIIKLAFLEGKFTNREEALGWLKDSKDSLINFLGKISRINLSDSSMREKIINKIYHKLF